MSKKENLTQQQKKFLSEYAKSLDAEKSAFLAGYTSKSVQMQACELLNKEKYQRELNALVEQNANRLEVSRAFIVKKYLQLIDWASGAFEIDENVERLTEGRIRSSTPPKDPAILLRGLDGLCKQLNNGDSGNENDENAMLTKIIGLNQEKI